MIRKIITIDQEKCIGCGFCVDACHEGAIALIDGKATLIRDDYCDGLGDCLPSCPVEAISFVEREAAPYDEAAVKANLAQKTTAQNGGCPGTRIKEMYHNTVSDCNTKVPSQLSQWPIQIKLVPTNGTFFNRAKVLIAADCTSFAYGNFHNDYIKGRVTLIGCPKLDQVDYKEKLAEIFATNDIEEVLVTRMEVPCCGGIENAVREGISASGKTIPLKVDTISIDGSVVK